MSEYQHAYCHSGTKLTPSKTHSDTPRQKCTTYQKCSSTPRETHSDTPHQQCTTYQKCSSTPRQQCSATPRQSHYATPCHKYAHDSTYSAYQKQPFFGIRKSSFN